MKEVEAEADYLRYLGAAPADAIAGLARLRARRERSVCTRLDSEIARLIFKTLCRMLSFSDTSDLGFPL